MSPVRLSSATRRCARFAAVPQFEIGGADDHEVAVDERRHRAAAVGREGGEFLAERSAPQQLAVLAEGDDFGAAAERVDVAGLGIGGRRGPADAVRRHVALKDVELVLPDHLARCRRRGTSPAPAAGAAPGGVLHADAIAHHDRRRAPAVRRAPQEVLAVERPRSRPGRSRARSRRDWGPAPPASRRGPPAAEPVRRPAPRHRRRARRQDWFFSAW